MNSNDEEVRIKEKMAELVNRWAGKVDDPNDKLNHCRRTIDRIIYRDLKKKLAHLNYLNPPAAFDLGVNAETLTPAEIAEMEKHTNEFCWVQPRLTS